MAERSSMKWRVRGLLRKNRVKPLFALILAGLPMLIVAAVTLFLMDSPLWGIRSLFEQVRALFVNNDLQTAALLLLYGGLLDYSPLVASIPACAVFVAVYLFIGMPISVSTSEFLLSFLRGKDAKASSVYGCFSGRYPRNLGGMLYKQFWLLLWGVAAVALPILLGIAGNFLVETYTVQLNLKIYFFVGVVALSVVLFFILLILWINRLLAYHLTAICLAAQPRLSPSRAVRLSRKLMRGQKGRLLGLYLSFLNYYIPAILCEAALPLLPNFAALFELDDGLVSVIRMGLLLVICLNLLVTLYVGPYCSLSVRAFYIERKREALLDEELTPEDFASEPVKAKA